VRWVPTVQATWLTFASFPEVTYSETRVTDSGFRDVRIDWISAIIKVYVGRERLAREFDADSPRWNILKLIAYFNSSIETVNF